MDVFKLMGRIAIDASGAEGDIDRFTKKAGSASKKIAHSFEQIGKAVSGTAKGLVSIGEATEQAGKRIAQGIAVGAAAVTTAAVAIGKNALNVRSSIEQGMGGAEAVFLQYADDIKNASKDAWKTAGLSAEEYLATANKMGSLFKGAGFDEATAMNYTTEAMQRAADVASIMGLDIESAMESIAGMAKGNFTMMDNLGVAMNDTILEAYRLEKGMDKSVSKMTTAEKVGLAFEMFMERTAGYAGNYAKENETAAGSLQTLKSAWSNFLGGVGTFEDLEKSAFGYLTIAAKTMGLDALEPMIQGAQETVQEVAKIISMEDLSGQQKFSEARRYLLAKSVSLANTMGEKFVQGASTASGMISETLSDINVSLPNYIAVGQSIFDSVRDGVKQAAEQLTDTAAIVSPALISNWFTMKTDFIGIGLDILGGISQGIADDLALGDESQVGASLKNGMNTLFEGMKENFPKMAGLATALIDGISDAITSEGAGEKAGEVVTSIVTELNNWINDGGVGKFTTAATSFLLGLGAELVSAAPTVLAGFVSGIWDGLTGILSGVTNFFSDEDTKEMQALKESLTAISDSFTATQTAIDLATSAYETSMEDLNARLALAEGHLETIRQLEEAAVLSPEDNEAWKNAVAAVVALYPELGEYVDAETGKFNINSDAIRANIAALQDLARQKTLQKIQEEYSEQAVEISTNMVEAQAALTAAENRYIEKYKVKNLLNKRVDNGDYFSGFDTLQTQLLKENIGDFEKYFTIGLDGSSKLNGNYTGSQLQKLFIQWLGEANTEFNQADADVTKAQAEIENGKQQLAELGKKAQEVADAYNVVFPAIDNMASAANHAAGAMNSIHSGGTVTPNAKGAVFSAPTIFDTRLGRQMVGEAGPEAVAPISVLQKYVQAAVQSANANNEGQRDETIITGNTFVIQKEQDIYALAAELHSLKRESRRGRGQKN